MRVPVLLAVAVLTPVLTLWLGTRSILGAGIAVFGLVLVGALIWRFDHLPWIDIASWTLPMAVWLVAALWIIDSPVRWLVAETSAAVWLLAFIFWTGVTRWWYRRVLRKPFPYP